MLKKIKALLGFAETDTDIDSKLKIIIELVTSRLALLTGFTGDVPEELEHIVIEVSVARFNKIGSEGYQIHVVEGEHYNYSNDDFAPFAAEIAEYKAQKKKESHRKVCFL